MKFESFAQLIEVIKTHPQYNNDIKLKRLKKQLQILSTYQKQGTTIEHIYLSSIGIELLIQNTYRQGCYEYNMILDFQYPFNRPQIHYMKKDSQFANCKDLLDILLEGTNWGPSLMLTFFLDKIENISEIIQENNALQAKWVYHTNECYRKQYLQDMHIRLFQIQQYTWKYMIKTTKKRILGLTNQVLFIFSTTKNDQNLLLDFWKPINQIQTAKATVSNNKKFNLEISYTSNQKQNKLYLGGSLNIETILGYLNPIQMIERKITSIERNPDSLKTGKYWDDNQQMIREFTQLIEHYSLKDTVKSQKYIRLMKQMIQKFYSAQQKMQQKGSKKQQFPMQQQQIQT